MTEPAATTTTDGTCPWLRNLGAACLGMYAAIKICLHNGIDPHALCDMVTKEIFDTCDTCCSDADQQQTD